MHYKRLGQHILAKLAEKMCIGRLPHKNCEIYHEYRKSFE